MLTVLHASDFQCGRPFRQNAAEALVRFADDLGPDVVVVSGDLTQRAKKREFALVKTILRRLPQVPCIVTPGNHDVPLFRVFERLVNPYRNWRSAISPDLNTVTRLEGVTFVALNSSAPRRALVNGRIDPFQIELARDAFASVGPADIRALVIHHHFVPVPDGTDGTPLPRAAELVGAFEDMGVDFVLGGHVHQTHVTTSSDLLGERAVPGIPLIACGTTTSWRGRGPEADLNSLNVVRVHEDEVEIVPHILEQEGRVFEPRAPIVLPRRTASGTSGAAAGDGGR
ncbi:MAG: metallophosphoesterase [Gemmatimonadota bacterium]|jgi:3',5'-cyclic AMP phosphodiesterase CpdA